LRPRPTGLIGLGFGVKFASRFFHSFSGWAVFVFALICLFNPHGLLRWTGGRLARLRA